MIVFVQIIVFILIDDNILDLLLVAFYLIYKRESNVRT